MSLQKQCQRLVSSSFFSRLSLGVILFSSALIGLETVDSVVAQYGKTLKVTDFLILSWFVFEIACRMAAHGRNLAAFFKCPWNVFDFLIVGITLLPAVSPALSVFRLFRIFRVLRLLSAVPELQILVSALLKTIPSMGYVGMLLFLIVYVYGVLGTQFFKAADPVHFGNLGLSLLTLFQISTLEDWSGIFWPLFQKFGWLAALYFLSFIFTGTMVLLNLLIGVVIRSMEQVQEEHAKHHRVIGHNEDQEILEVLNLIEQLKKKVNLIQNSKM
ncbi:MAG: ion transporter [Candidatus Omnitrophica bacterium]|nr:ion transporter [Candidatus Omnitrophota bacterium]